MTFGSSGTFGTRSRQDPAAAGRGRTAQVRSGETGPQPGSGADEVPAGDPASVARAICLRLLTGAPRTRAQLAQALATRDVPDDVAELVLTRFSEVGLIDDAEFSRTWVRSRHAGRGLARRALSHELRQRGVDEVTAAVALGSLTEEEEEETARTLVRRKLAATRRLDATTRTRRLAAMLARKGYSGAVALRVVREEVSGDEGLGDQGFETSTSGFRSLGADSEPGHASASP